MNPSKTGVILVNLGTPTEPTSAAVRSFLRAFLSDVRVVDTPRIIWLPILYGIILTLRPARVAVNYRKIWTKLGSPLMVNSLAQQVALQVLLDQTKATEGASEHSYKVELAMTYGEPSLAGAIEKLKNWGAQQMIVLPLYPQFSYTTTAAVTDQLEKTSLNAKQTLTVINDYHDDEHYIAALAESISPKLNAKTKLVMSFHGIPQRYVTQGDPYQQQCEISAKLLANKLNLNEEQWEIAYQSRVGREEWLKPYLDQRMQELAQEGHQNIVVVCPGFSVDCLETLEEIMVENCEYFMQAGGNSFEYVEALNYAPAHIQMMASLVQKNIAQDH